MTTRTTPRFVAFTVDKRGRAIAFRRGDGWRYFRMPLAEARELVATGVSEQEKYMPLSHWLVPSSGRPVESGN